MRPRSCGNIHVRRITLQTLQGLRRSQPSSPRLSSTSPKPLNGIDTLGKKVVPALGLTGAPLHHIRPYEGKGSRTETAHIPRM